MKMKVTSSCLGFLGLCGILLNGCAEKLPPAPVGTPSLEPVLATQEYERPAWSPDGKDLFFHGGPPEHFRLYRTSRRGGELVDILKQLHCGQVAVSRATGRMAYTSMGPNGTWCIWTANLDGSSPQRVTKGGRHVLPEWSPDGSQLSFLSLPDGTANIISAKGGEVKRIGVSLSPAVWSPLGQRIAIVQGEQVAGRFELVLISLADGTRRTLQSTTATNMPLNLWETLRPHFDWSPDGREIVWPTLVDGRMKLTFIDVQADKPVGSLPTEGCVSDPRFSPDGQWIAYASESSSNPRCIRVISRDGTKESPVTKPVEFLKGNFIRYASTGGLQIPSFLFRPSGGVKTKKPAIVWLHGGGGIGAALDEFDPGIQYFVRNGFVVLAPNYRTSRGFAVELVTITTLARKDIADDVAAAAAYLRSLEDVDPTRVAVLGASFGGYAVLSTITTYPSVFAAAVNINGPCDLSTLYRDAPVNRAVALAVLGGPPEQQAERYREESPITYADRIAIPLLAIHGTADATVPYRQSQVLMAALEKAGKRHKLITYDGIGHGFSSVVWANAMQHAMAFFLQELDYRPSGKDSAK